MNVQNKSPFDCTVEELDRELIARGAQMPEDERFRFTDKPGTTERDRVMSNLKELYDSTDISSIDAALSHVSTEELVDILLFKTRNMPRGIWGKDQRRDWFQVFEEPLKRNADTVAAICLKDDLKELRSGFCKLNAKSFGKAYNLCLNEPFYHQPIANGPFCTGFLVADDVVATAGHCVNDTNVTDLRFIFGYRMLDNASDQFRYTLN